MSGLPKVSVIIPAYNAQKYIGETLASVLAQSFGSLEIIVVDDGSTDQTAQVVRGFGSRVHYCRQDNSGGCAVPRNTGIRHCSGKYLCFIDADDIMAPDRIANQVEFLERHPEIGLVFSDYRNFTEEGPSPVSHFETCPRLRLLLRGGKEMILDKTCEILAQENFGIAGSFLMRKELLSDVPGFEPTLKACEDFHFYYRLARYTPVGILNTIGLMRRMHGNNMSSNPARMLSEGIRSRTLLRDGENDAVARRHLSRYIAECLVLFSRYSADNGKYADALKKEWEAFAEDSGVRRAWTACRGTARTLLMAMGLHTPGR